MKLSPFVDAKRFPEFEPILKGWIRAQRKFVDQTENFPWRYRERPGVGFLAGGAWLIGGSALEEWRTEKTRNGDACNGRCDLSIYHNNYCFHLEAKHLWLRGSKISTAKKLAEEKLEIAETAARELQTECRDEIRLGVLFVAPIFQPGDEQREMQQHLERWRKEIQSVPNDAMAWVFRSSRPTVKEQNDNYCPGTILLVRKLGSSRDLPSRVALRAV